MNIFNLDNIIKKFLIREGNESIPDTFGYLQVVNEILNKLKPSSLRDHRYIDVAKKHIYEITKHIKKLNERIKILEEQVSILEENNNKKNKR